MRLVSLFIFLLAISLSSFTLALTVEGAYVRGLPPGQMNTAAFMSLNNVSDQAIAITGARTDAAERAEIHAHIHNNGMMRMEQVEKIVVPAKGQFVLKPGGHHLMLMGLKKFLREGDQVKLQLLFADGTELDLELPVRSVLNEHKGMGSDKMDHSHH